MKRKLIELNQENLIVCDTVGCDFKVKNPTGDPNEDISSYINAPCPKCGSNLLTQSDYLQSIKFMKIVNWINRWFSWTTIFLANKPRKGVGYVTFKDGVSIKK